MLNKHLLLFGDSMVGAGYWNLGAGAGRPWGKVHTNMKGIVEPTLGSDGYPRINLNNAREKLPDRSDVSADSSGKKMDVAYLQWAEQYTGAGTVGDIYAARGLSPGILSNAGFSLDPEEEITMDPREAARYAPYIINALQSERRWIEDYGYNHNTEEVERGLMAYFNGPGSVDQKVQSYWFTAEVRDGQLWGVAECKIRGDLTPLELQYLINNISGQEIGRASCRERV